MSSSATSFQSFTRAILQWRVISDDLQLTDFVVLAFGVELHHVVFDRLLCLGVRGIRVEEQSGFGIDGLENDVDVHEGSPSERDAPEAKTPTRFYVQGFGRLSGPGLQL